MAQPKFRTAYGPKKISEILFRDEEGNHDGLTEQHHKEACDIYSIIKRADRTGLLDHVNATQGHYGDYTEVNEYQEALNIVIHAQDSFSALPAHIRKRFGNDPGEYIEFVTNPENLEEMQKLGLAIPAPKVDEIPPKTKATAEGEQLPT